MLDIAGVAGIVSLLIAKGRRVAGGNAQDYLVNLTTLAVSLSNHTVPREEFIRIALEMIESSAQDMYEEAAGTGYAMEDDDYNLIGDWRDTQVEPLVNLAYAIENEGLSPVIQRRLRLWAGSISSLGAVGFMQSHRTMEAEWRASPLTERCETCLGLNGHIHQLGWYLDKGYIPGQPGSATLICGGWGCKCGLFSTKTGRRLLPLVRMWNI